MLIIFLTLTIILYAFPLQQSHALKTYLTSHPRNIHILHFILLSVCLLLAVASCFNLYLRGYYTSRLLISSTLLSSIIAYKARNMLDFKLLSRIYYGVYYFSPIPIILCYFLVPFLGLAIVALIQYYTIGDPQNIYYYDKHYRIQESYTGILAPAPAIDLFEKHGIFESKVSALHFEPPFQFDSIAITSENNDVLTIKAFSSPEKDSLPKVQEIQIFNREIQ